MHGGLAIAMGRGRKKKYKGSAPPRPVERKPDDRILSSLQPHRRWLPEAHRLSEKAGSMLGCLNLKGFISDELHEAGRRYGVIRGAYMAVVGGPTGTAGTGRGYTCLAIASKPASCEFPPDQCECIRRTANYLSARFALSSAGDDVLRAVEALVFDDRMPEDMADLECGLCALQAHFGLTAGRRK